MQSQFRRPEKIPVAILGATGSVGQQFISLLAHHPWFEIAALAASEKSVGKPYKEAVNWLMPTPLPESIGNMEMFPCKPGLPASLVFSALDSSVSKEIETAFAEAGAVVISNSQSHRMDAGIPLLVPEVNSAHLHLIKEKQQKQKGFIITNPNCVATGLVMGLKPLEMEFGLESVFITTLQALSGAGFPGVASMEIADNVIPFIKGEEEKVETEPLKILGHYENNQIIPLKCKISAQVNRVPVTNGHLACISIKLKKKPAAQDIIEAWSTFRGPPQALELPSAPARPLVYFEDERFPQPRLHRDLEKGMAVSVGRLRECPILDYKFVLLSHNTIRGGAGCSILNAELCVKEGMIFW